MVVKVRAWSRRTNLLVIFSFAAKDSPHIFLKLSYIKFMRIYIICKSKILALVIKIALVQLQSKKKTFFFSNIPFR